MRPLVAAALVAILAAAAPARAGEPDAATTLSAVQLADEAGELFQAGRFAEALDRYQRADALVHRHTIGVRIARCLARLGRLSEAANRYDAVTRMPLPVDLEPDKLTRQKEALGQASAERDALLPRIPGVVVQLAGPPATVVTIDGQRLPEALLGVRRAIDPGAHRVEARLGDEVVVREVTLKEGEVVTLPLELHERATSPVDAKDRGPAIALLPAPPPPESPLPSDIGRRRRSAGFVLVGVGAAGIVTGIVAGGLAIAGQHSLQSPSKCGGNFNSCAPSAQSEVDTYNGERHVSTAGFVAGGIMAATGIVLVVTALPPKIGSTASLFAAPGGGGLRGTF